MSQPEAVNAWGSTGFERHDGRLDVMPLNGRQVRVPRQVCHDGDRRRRFTQGLFRGAETTLSQIRIEGRLLANALVRNRRGTSRVEGSTRTVGMSRSHRKA